MYFADHKYSSVEAAFYAGFHRTVFALAVGWIVFATVLGYAGKHYKNKNSSFQSIMLKIAT